MVVAKRKTVCNLARVVKAPKGNVEEVPAGKMKGTMKKPAAAAQKLQKKKLEELAEEDSEEEESVESGVSEEGSEEEAESSAEEESEEESEKPSKVLKKPAAAGGKAQKKMDTEEASEEEESAEEDASEEEESEEEEEEASEADEDTAAQIVPVEEKEVSEKELAAARTKELSSMYMDDLKELVVNNGLATGKKDVMIKSLIKHEAKARAVAKEQKAKIRAVVIKKKQELEGCSTSELGKLCDTAGLKGLKSKEERVQRLLVHWQENDGVDKALAQIAQEERTQELTAMDNGQLVKLCKKMGVDPLVKEVMVDRISTRENAMGSYCRPTLPQDEVAAASQSDDMVEALLASEAKRKKEKELKRQQEDKVAQKRKELKSMSIDDLKKRLVKKGLEATGTKDDMVEALFVLALQEDAVATRQFELKSKSLQDLKELLSRHGLESGSKEHMIKAILAYEAKVRENLKAFEAKIGDAVAQKKEQLNKKTKDALKEMCSAKGLAVKGDKEERIERLVEEAQKEGELDVIVSMNIRNKRKEELMAVDKPSLVNVCEKVGVEPFAKGIIVERIIAHESESGAAIAVANAEAPPTKKARK